MIGGHNLPGWWASNFQGADMVEMNSNLRIIPCVDSAKIGELRRQELDLPRTIAAELGRSAVEAAREGYYYSKSGEQVDWSLAVQAACAAKISIPPEAILPEHERVFRGETRVQIANETTLQAAQRLLEKGLLPLVLNFANGIQPGGGFLSGSKAQEEVLCRSSALYLTLVDDPMYLHHRKRHRPDSTDWAIYSPDVPVFRKDDGTVLEHPWLLSFLTCAAPYAPSIGQPESGDLLQKRIGRVLAIARAFGYSAVVLGAWGCGAFANDPYRTAVDFREELETEFRGAFSEVVFAITDWSPERRFFGPFREVFMPSVAEENTTNGNDSG